MLVFRTMLKWLKYFIIIFIFDLLYCFLAWIWVPTATHSWHEAHWAFHAIYVWAPTPTRARARATRSKSCWQTHQWCSSATRPTSGLDCLAFLLFCWNIFLSSYPSVQMLPRGRGYRYPDGRGMSDISSHGLRFRDDAGKSQRTPIGALASALANASPNEQRTVSILFFYL